MILSYGIGALEPVKLKAEEVQRREAEEALLLREAEAGNKRVAALTTTVERVQASELEQLQRAKKAKLKEAAEASALLLEQAKKLQKQATYLKAKARKKLPVLGKALTASEATILNLILRGLSDKQISEALKVTISNVRNHKTAIYKKQGLSGPHQIGVAHVTR